MPPSYMLDMGKQTKQFFDSYLDAYGQKKYRLKSIEQYSREHNTNEQPGKQYFKATTLPEIVNTAPMPNFKSRQGHEVEKGMPRFIRSATLVTFTFLVLLEPFSPCFHSGIDVDAHAST